MSDSPVLWKENGHGEHFKRMSSHETQLEIETRKNLRFFLKFDFRTFAGACCKKCYEIFRSQFRSILGKNATNFEKFID